VPANGRVALELAAREPDTTSLRLRLPTQMTAKARADVHCGPQIRIRLSRIQPLRPGSTPDSHHLEQIARPRRAASASPLPRRWKDRKFKARESQD
jgi:hypothetical protein